MNLEIEPYVGIGPIRFGMTRKEVRKVVPAPPHEFTKSPTSPAPTDAFDELGIHVFYSAEDRCEAVEVTSPSSPTLHGKAFMGSSYDEAETWLRAKDPGIETDEAGLTSAAFGVGVYAEAAKSRPNGPVEAVIAFRRGYYESSTMK